MKKLISLFIAAFVVVGCILPQNFAYAAPQSKQTEQIKSYTVHVTIPQSGVFHVKEDILYNFGTGPTTVKHGIYRDIPIEYGNGLLKNKIDIDHVSVTDASGLRYNFQLLESNGNKRIKIGDADISVEGEKEYIIQYDVTGALVFENEADIVNWNMIGTNWQVPIHNISVQAEVAPQIDAKVVRVDCFQGKFSSTTTCPPQLANTQENIFVYNIKELAPYEGATVKIQFEPKTFARPTALDHWLAILKEFWPLFIPLITFLFLLVKWFKTGRDPKGKGTLIVEFDSPDNLTPLEVGTLIDEKTDQKDISAEIISLAQQGYIHIVQHAKEGWFGSRQYTLEQLKDESSLQNEFDKILLKGLFKESSTQTNKSGVLATVTLDDLKYKFTTVSQSIKKEVPQALTTKGYFNGNPQKVRNTYAIIGFGTIFLLIFFGSFVQLNLGMWFILSLCITAFLFIIFSPLMASRTQKGVYAREHIMGLKQYLSVAEKDRIKFHNAPEKNPQVFEQFLPYAMVLGVEKEWAAQFADIYKEMSPSWYSASGNAHFGALYLAQSLGNFSSTSNTILTAQHSSSGSGGGGGFSGGGFGGGGGGSW